MRTAIIDFRGVFTAKSLFTSPYKLPQAWCLLNNSSTVWPPRSCLIHNLVCRESELSNYTIYGTFKPLLHSQSSCKWYFPILHGWMAYRNRRNASPASNKPPAINRTSIFLPSSNKCSHVRRITHQVHHLRIRHLYYIPCLSFLNMKLYIPRMLRVSDSQLMLLTCLVFAIFISNYFLLTICTQYQYIIPV